MTRRRAGNRLPQICHRLRITWQAHGRHARHREPELTSRDPSQQRAVRAARRPRSRHAACAERAQFERAHAAQLARPRATALHVHTPTSRIREEAKPKPPGQSLRCGWQRPGQAFRHADSAESRSGLTPFAATGPVPPGDDRPVSLSRLSCAYSQGSTKPGLREQPMPVSGRSGREATTSGHFDGRVVAARVTQPGGSGSAPLAAHCDSSAPHLDWEDWEDSISQIPPNTTAAPIRRVG